MTPATSGPALLAPSAYYDPDSSSWRTSGVMFPSDWPTSSETCPPWGMTRAGELYELPTPEPPTDAPASSSPRILGTPTASSKVRSPEHSQGRAPSPVELVQLLPTPIADNSRGLAQPGTAYASLPNAVLDLLPTPTAMDMGRGRTPEAWDDWRSEMQERHGNGNGHGRSLEIEAQRLLPTPTAMDAHGSRGYRPDGTPYTATAGVTLTDAALSSSGAHTAPRSTAGSESSDDQHPDQLSLDAPESA